MPIYEKKLMDILKLKQLKKMEKARKNAKEFCIKEEERINSVLEELNEQGKIDKQLLKSIKSVGGQLPRLYGLAKVNKQNIPVRPVLSIPGSPYYKVAEKITEWLSVILESKINCSSKQTVDNLRNISLDQDEVLISFDVTSLLTNVPVKEAIFEAAEKLYSGKFPMPPVDKETFIIFAELATTNVLMLTHDGPYRQIAGLAVGSQPAPPLSNIWLSKYEPNIRDDAKLFERFMDDILRTMKQQFIQAKLKEINALHPNLKFTLEVEAEGKLPFLDLCINHVTDKPSSIWYCKPTDTELIMKFHALSPKRYERSVVEGFVHRVHRACSSWENFHEKVKMTLQRNQYPPNFYDPIISNTIEKLSSPKENQKDQIKDVTSQKSNIVKQNAFIEYRGSVVTDHFIKKLKNIGTPLQPVITIRKMRTCLPSLKCAVKKNLKSRVFYKIVCPGCNACCVGHTSRHLITRFSEHKYKCNQPVRAHK